MVIFDREKQKIFEFNSDPDFDIQVTSHLLSKVQKQQFGHSKFTNDDWDFFLKEKTVKKGANGDDSSDNQDSDNEKVKGGKKRNKDYNKEQHLMLQQLQDTKYYEDDEFMFESKLQKFIKPENQKVKYKRQVQAKVLDRCKLDLKSHIQKKCRT